MKPEMRLLCPECGYRIEYFVLPPAMDVFPPKVRPLFAPPALGQFTV